MTGRPVARSGALGALLSVFLLVACTTGTEPAPSEPAPPSTAAPTTAPTTPEEEPSSPEPTTEPGPGPTPWPQPTRPGAMDREDIEGAIAAAEYFLALYPYVYATGDLDTWQEMSHPECQFCQSTVDNVTEIYADGGYAISGEFVIDEIGASPPDDEYAHFRVGVYGTEEPWTTYGSDGDILSSTDGGQGSYHFGVLRSDGEWQVRGVFAESEA